MHHGTARLRTLALALITVLQGCSDREARVDSPEAPSASILPMTLHGMPLVAITTGEAAKTMLRRLHGRDVAPASSHVGHYEGGGAQATLYISHFTDAAAADSMVKRMSRSLGSGNRAFAHHKRLPVDGVQVHAVLGRGQSHFFFARDGDVAWLGVDGRMARVVLAHLLDIEADRLPSGVVLDGVDILPPADSLYRRQGLRSATRSGRR